MYDTVGFRVKLGNDQLVAIRELQNKVQEIRHNGEVVWQYQKGVFRHPSYSRQIYFFFDKDSIKFQFSMPKFLYGHNVCNFEELRKGTELFRQYAQECMEGIKFPSVDEWEVTRVDFSINYILPASTTVTKYLEYLSGFDYNRKQRQYYNGTVMYRGSSYSIKFYDKQKEFSKHDLKYLDAERAAELTTASTNMLRFELTGRHEFLKYYLNKDKIYLSDLSTDRSREIINQMLKKLFSSIPSEYQERSNDIELLCKNFTTTEAYRLWGMLELFKYPGKKRLLQTGLNKRKIYRDLAKLRSAGLFDLASTTDLNEFEHIKLGLPSDLAQRPAPALVEPGDGGGATGFPPIT